MRFAAIAVSIGIGAAYARQAIPMAGYAYALEICSIKIPKKDLHLREFAVNNQNGLTISKVGLNSRLVKQSASEFRLKVSRKDKGNLICWEKVRAISLVSIALN
ncbi:hypothetical protein HUN01_25840 [Nostoc edaphicum CCNP1411]|uniref:Uncharacterized protein n=1 Tax=Nostoc edaphicum CCNP1411 TaxID=1472755 RepID=A0A7D7LHF9_9NOSO|nr:hypothetical protein [Nostoc edaphicum]QMS90832.1 hypothetical protein HUN01_25840 [Nostoc edaphicum CCNP1411]